MAIAHYLEMLDKHRDLVTPQVIFGGKNPHPNYLVAASPARSTSTIRAPRAQW